jgi:hypothetical protein
MVVNKKIKQKIKEKISQDPEESLERMVTSYLTHLPNSCPASLAPRSLFSKFPPDWVLFRWLGSPWKLN